jgi:SAM-dependent methyltransferase
MGTRMPFNARLRRGVRVSEPLWWAPGCRRILGVMSDQSALATYFDGWYADMANTPAKDEIMQRHLGLPPYLVTTSTIPWVGIAELEAGLHLDPGQTLLDLACGRGGIGLEIAARTGARVIGVDLSAVAVRQARDTARRLNCAGDFHIGELTAIGLDTGSVDALLCVDSIHFADPPEAAYHEIRRVLAPGGRVVLTCWEPREFGDARLPARLRGVDLAGGLAAAGFEDVQTREQPVWRDAEHAMWQEAAALDPGDSAALRSFHAEGVRSLETFDLLRRVTATATAPAATSPAW